MLRRRTTVVLALILALVAGCSSSPDTRGPLPDAHELIAAAATGLGGVRSMQYEINVNGSIPGVNIRDTQGWASREGGPAGTAVGHADMQEAGNLFALTYEISGDSLTLIDQHGTRTRQPVPAEYNPAELLADGQGLSKLLTSATGLKTEAKEDVKGVETYRVTGELSREVIATLLPQIWAGADVKFWVTQAMPCNLVRVWMQVPPRQPNEGAVMLELGLSELNTPRPTTTPAG